MNKASETGIEIFKTICIGKTSKEDLISELINANIKFNRYAEMLFADSDFSVSEAQKFKIVVTSVSQLKLVDGATSHEIFKAAQNLGLELYPLDLAPWKEPILTCKKHRTSPNEKRIIIIKIKWNC